MRFKAVAAGVLAMAASSTMVLTPGIAAADDYAGQKYSDVQSKLGDADLTGVIATRVGDIANDDDCVVESSQKAPWIKGDDFAPVTDTVLLNLNCNLPVATSQLAGNSAASPEGRAAIAAAAQKAQQDQEQAAADQAKAKH
ncbi:hypothetical protein [Mycolicibacterium stellerae]|uniref:hypothetical protein n=1 Tax=Mycolicibacterium stellerae TaxID=2358193 RepID=UPI000F0B9B5A|nr:hypothetical protein [Mycolicibacterium stellerae]